MEIYYPGKNKFVVDCILDFILEPNPLTYGTFSEVDHNQIIFEST